jgi:hypothetical protein
MILVDDVPSSPTIPAPSKALVMRKARAAVIGKDIEKFNVVTDAPLKRECVIPGDKITNGVPWPCT